MFSWRHTARYIGTRARSPLTYGKSSFQTYSIQNDWIFLTNQHNIARVRLLSQEMSPKGHQGNRIWDYKTPVKMSRVALPPCTTRCILIFISLNVFFSILLSCREIPVEISVMGIELIDITYSRLRHIQRLSTLVAFLSRPLPFRTIVYTVYSILYAWC